MTDGFFKNKHEFELISAEFDRREQAEIDAALSRAGEAEIRRMLEIDRLEKLLEADYVAYHREGGSDKMMVLLSRDRDQLA